MRNKFVFLIGMTALLLSTGSLAEIYRTVDQDGNVVYTDVPPKDGQQAEKIKLPKASTYETQKSQRRTTENGRELWIVDGDDAENAIDADEEAPKIAYSSVSIVSPRNDHAVRDNAGNLTISVAVQPKLGTNHQVRLRMNGAPRGINNDLTFSLSNVNRGTHTLLAEVLDENGQVLIASRPQTFHMLRYFRPPGS